MHIVLLCLALASGIVSTGLCISYSAQCERAIKPISSTEASDVLSTVVLTTGGDEEATDSLSGMPRFCNFNCNRKRYTVI